MKHLKMRILALALISAPLTSSAMFKLDYEIEIGANTLKGVESIEIETSQDLLSDFCRITLPGMVRGVPFKIEDKVKRGDAVTVKLGYNGSLKTEFKGYLKAIYPESPMKLECEDSVYLFRRKVTSKVLKDVTVKKILEYVLSEVNPQISTPFKLSTSLSGDSFKWERFTIHNATGFEVLDKLRQESGLMIYARDNELHAHLAFTQSAGLEVVYDFARNIEDTNDLRYVKAQDTKVKVVVVGRTAKGTKLEGEAGETGGEVRTIQRPTISSKTTLENIAKEELKKLSYDGYKGEIVGWLVPYCSTGYAAKVIDQDYPDRAGKYYVMGTKVRFSANGGVRAVSLGFKLS
jgi:hypothetical protein